MIDRALGRLLMPKGKPATSRRTLQWRKRGSAVIPAREFQPSLMRQFLSRPVT